MPHFAATASLLVTALTLAGCIQTAEPLGNCILACQLTQQQTDVVEPPPQRRDRIIFK